MSMPVLCWGTQTWTQHSRVPHQCWLEGKGHAPRPAGVVLPNAAQDTAGLLCDWGTLLACLHSGPLGSFLQSCFQTVCFQPIVVYGVTRPEWGLCISPCRALWDSSLPISPACQGPAECQHHPLVHKALLQILSSANLLRVHLFNVQVINEDVKQYWPHYRPLEYTTDDWPPCSIIARLFLLT